MHLDLHQHSGRAVRPAGAVLLVATMLKAVQYICGNPTCGNITTMRIKADAAPRERHQAKCVACRKRRWHWLWTHRPITGRTRRQARATPGA